MKILKFILGTFTYNLNKTVIEFKHQFSKKKYFSMQKGWFKTFFSGIFLTFEMG